MIFPYYKQMIHIGHHINPSLRVICSKCKCHQSPIIDMLQTKSDEDPLAGKEI